MQSIYLTIALAPLAAAIIAGLFGKSIGKSGAHGITILCVGISCVLSFYVLYQILFNGLAPYNGTVYTWLVSDGVSMNVGFLIDRLSAMMMVVVTFVSLMVHIYTIGYMDEDPGYQRFFSYISLFTFSMLMLVMSNNFMQLFFGWEGVGVVSYLLIGFWYTRPTAIFANLKAFLVNRVGDFGFVLGIAAVLRYTGSLDYATVFAHADQITAAQVHVSATIIWPAITFTCICLFVGAMGKSAQIPLHIWLPDSMEGPTPISALIHAATMVTAGIFMVARMSPLFELSETALSMVLIIGATTAFFMGLLGIVANDIKRVIAYSTLSQLGYMTVALGASAYGAGIFHLMTHAFFKALLFLAAGSVIMAMHHEQDMRKMGGLRKYLPITYWTCLVGSLALIGFPGTSGFFSKDALIDAVHLSHRAGAGLRLFLRAERRIHHGPVHLPHVLHDLPRPAAHGSSHAGTSARESLGGDRAADSAGHPLGADRLVHGGADAVRRLFRRGHPRTAGQRCARACGRGVSRLAAGVHVGGIQLAGRCGWPRLGVLTAWLFFLKRPDFADAAERRFKWLHTILVDKYGFDWFNEHVIMAGARLLGGGLWRFGDQIVIDDGLVNGSARSVGWLGSVMRYAQSGYLYHYAFAMILGLASFLLWILWRT